MKGSGNIKELSPFIILNLAGSQIKVPQGYRYPFIKIFFNLKKILLKFSKWMKCTYTTFTKGRQIMKTEFKFFQTNPIKADIFLLFFSLDE